MILFHQCSTVHLYLLYRNGYRDYCDNRLLTDPGGVAPPPSAITRRHSTTKLQILSGARDLHSESLASGASTFLIRPAPVETFQSIAGAGFEPACKGYEPFERTWLLDPASNQDDWICTNDLSDPDRARYYCATSCGPTGWNCTIDLKLIRFAL